MEGGDSGMDTSDELHELNRQREKRATAHDKWARKHDDAASNGGDRSSMHEAAAEWHSACRDAYQHERS
jgi:transcription elongation GreA/GreB family factor